MKKGFWATHKYSRISVERDVQEFCGWPRLLELVAECDKTTYRADQQDHLRERDKALVATLFETGGRVSEVLMLRKRNFDIQRDRVLVKGMRVLKRYRKVGEYQKKGGKKSWKTEPVFTTRGIFTVRRFEPLTPIMVSWIETCNDYIFPSGSNGSELPYLGRTRVYQILRDLGKRVDIHLYSHWFRAQRASQLASEYGFREHELLRWFSWKRYETAMRYSKLSWRDLDAKMTSEKLNY